MAITINIVCSRKGCVTVLGTVSMAVPPNALSLVNAAWGHLCDTHAAELALARQAHPAGTPTWGLQNLDNEGKQ